MTLQPFYIVYKNYDNYNKKNKINTEIHSNYHNVKIIKINTKFYKFISFCTTITLPHAYIATHHIDSTTIPFLSKWHSKLTSSTSNITLLLYNNTHNHNLSMLHIIIQFCSSHHIKIIHL